MSNVTTTLTTDNGRAAPAPRHLPAAPPAAGAQGFSLAETETLARHFVRSAMFPDARSESQAVVKIMLGRTIGIDPVSSMTGLYVSKQGKLMMTANLMAAVIQRSGKADYKVKDVGPSSCVIRYWDLRGGQREELPALTTTAEQFSFMLSGPNRENWQRYPANMLFARNISNAAKFYFPGLFGGSPVYLPDELPNSGIRVDGETLEVVQASPAPSPVPLAATLRLSCAEAGLDLGWVNQVLAAGFCSWDDVDHDSCVRALALLADRRTARQATP